MSDRRFSQATPEGRVLLALRPGEMSSLQLLERFGAAYAKSLQRLVELGLVERPAGRDAIWHLTRAGRDACPNRRDPVPLRYGRGRLSTDINTDRSNPTWHANA